MSRWNASSLKIGLLRRYSTYLGVRVSPRPPILVYQMGKVASSSVRNSLLLHGVGPVLHLHSFSPLRERRVEEIGIEEELRQPLSEEIAHARKVFERAPLLRRVNLLYRERVYNRRIYELCIGRDRTAKIVTLVRDPVGTNLSMFFERFAEYAGVSYVPGAFSTDEIVDLFGERYGHSRPLTWFDVEMKTSLGLDVYRWPFPTDRGHLVANRGKMDLLILQCELADSEKERAISEFLGLEGFRMARSNIGAHRSYGAQYQEVKRRIRLPASLLDRLYHSKYARHFYSESDREKLRSRWEGPS